MFKSIFFRSKKSSGFTLIEIMVVVCIIGVLASIISFSYGRIRRNVYEKACQQNMKTIYGAAQYYWIEIGKLPANHQQLTTNLLAREKYLKKIPRCPYAGPKDDSGKVFYTITGESDDEIKVKCVNLINSKYAHGFYKNGD